MITQKIILTIMGLLITVLLISGYNQKTFACGCGGHSHSSPSSSYQMSPPVIIVPPPPGFPHKWFAKDVVESFDKKGLKVAKLKPIIEEADSNFIINMTNKAVRFDLASLGEDVRVYIHTFETTNDLDMAQKHFLELNKKGELYTWSFVKDNILLVLTGTVREEIARQYESALYNLKE